jgi:hypothetical protein
MLGLIIYPINLMIPPLSSHNLVFQNLEYVIFYPQICVKVSIIIVKILCYM